MALRRFFLDARLMGADRPAIEGADARHILQVLRLTVGDRLILFDGSGTECESEIISTTGDACRVKVLRAYESSVESPLSVTVALGLLKDRKMDSLVRQLTELGVCRIIPFLADRSVARPDKKRAAGRRARWEKVALESLKQCGRSRAPRIDPVTGFKDMLESAPQGAIKIVFWEDADQPLDTVPVLPESDRKHALVVFGPEGGLNAHEVRSARGRGFLDVSLGPRILRAETAVIAGSALVQYRFGDMAEPVKRP